MLLELAIINDSTVVTDDQVLNALPAFQAQVSDDFAPVWLTDAILKFYAKGVAIPPTACRLSIADDSDQAGALGYHLTTLGVPYGYVFAKSDISAGLQWTGTASHEILELLADMFVMSVVDVPNGRGGTIVALEVCDAPEADQWGYSRPGADGTSKIQLSDFVTPSWFGNPVPKAGYVGCKGPYDFMGHCPGPFTILSGGYQGVKSYGAAGQWGQVTAAVDPDAQKPYVLKADGTKMAEFEIPKFSRRARRIENMAAAEKQVMPTSSFLGGVYEVHSVSAIQSQPTALFGGGLGGAGDSISALVNAISPNVTQGAADAAVILKHVRDLSDKLAAAKPGPFLTAILKAIGVTVP